jgi:hypothetical protein
VDWSQEAWEMRSRLATIETAANSASIPAPVLKELKASVDHCRTALWAASLATQDAGGYQSTALILSARMQRLQEMCERLQDDVLNGHVWKETPGLARFVATLAETERQVRSISDQAAAR